MQTGQKIAQLRLKAGLTQQQLADKLFVTQQLVSKWENGTRRPDYLMLKEMADIFSLNAEDIFPAEETVLDELSLCIPENMTASAEELTDKINSFLPLLSEKERFIFIRRYYFTDTSKEIAAKLGTGSNQVRSVLSRTRIKLKKYMSEVEL